MSEQLALFIDFENVAIWAEQHFFDLDLNRMMEYLRSRGPVVVKRAYGDWGRFARYRDDLVDNSIDLVQMYSVRAGKNRADIRLALDAFETAINRPQIVSIAIVSGDSDFGALAAKLREYGRYILGIGPREITHSVLVKSCDEFIYLETLLGQGLEPTGSESSKRGGARTLLRAALAAHGRRGELPILGAKLKQTMLSLDPTFNEANLGYGQFRTWLENNDGIVNLFFKDLQMYVAPADFEIPEGFAVAPRSETQEEEKPAPAIQRGVANPYAGVFAKAIGVELETRRDVLRDVYRELRERPGDWTIGSLLDELQSRYEAKGLVRSKTLLRKLVQLGFYQGAYEYLGSVSVNTPVRLVEDLNGQASFIRRAESNYPYAVIKAGLEIDPGEMAAALLEDRSQVGYIQELVNDLEQRGYIVQVAGRYRLPGYSKNPLLDNPYLEDIVQELKAVQLPADLGRDVETAKELAQRGMSKRSQDYAAAAQDFLLASRLQWDAVERNGGGATLEDLRWYLASYASVKAGELSQNHGQYAAASPYYLAFFSLVQEEDTPLWNRMRGLINPILSFYWRNLARELGIDLGYTISPDALAVQMAGHPDTRLRERWEAATQKLGAINPDVLRRVASQIRLTQEDSEVNIQVAAQIEGMLGE